MKESMSVSTESLSVPTDNAVTAARVFSSDVVRGMLAVSRNSLAVVGLGVLGCSLLVVSQPEWRHGLETQVAQWLSARHPQMLSRPAGADHTAPDDGSQRVAQTQAGTNAVSSDPSRRLERERVTATDPAQLTKQQEAIAKWLARRYKVAPEPVGRLVQEAWRVGKRTNVEPTLILAIMAIESNFNPFAQSKVGAQGLMQVMTQLHGKKYSPFGGTYAAFDPVSNLQVGVQVLKECIALAGDVKTALQYYSGAARLPNDQGYANKVLSEQAYLKDVAAGREVTILAPINRQPSPVRPFNASATADPTTSDDDKAAGAPPPPAPGAGAVVALN